MREFFDIIKIIFTDPIEYKEITKGEKQKMFFLLQRRFVINFPMEANVLQHLKINQSAVIDWWQSFLRKQYKFVPGWMYTKGVEKTQKIKEKKANVSNDLINEYCKCYKIDRKSVKDALEFYHDLMISELKEFEKAIK